MFDRHVHMMGIIIRTYSFTKDRNKLFLKLMHPKEFVKKPKPKRVELMMQSRDVNHLGKGRLVLFAIAKEKPMEEVGEFVVELSFVDDLDSRTSLSQTGENDVNARAQA